MDEWERQPDDPECISAVREMLNDNVTLTPERSQELIEQYLEKMKPTLPLKACCSCGIRDPQAGDISAKPVNSLPKVFRFTGLQRERREKLRAINLMVRPR